MSWHREYVFFIQDSLPLSLVRFFDSQEQLDFVKPINSLKADLDTQIDIEENFSQLSLDLFLDLDVEKNIDSKEQIAAQEQSFLDEQVNQNPNAFDFTSRSDIFGIIVRDIIQHFLQDLTALQFFQERNEQDLEVETEVFENRLVSFDHQQQKQIITEIDQLFRYTTTQPTIFEEWAAEFDSDPLQDQLVEVFRTSLENFDWSYNDQSFVEVMMILKFIKEFFEKSLEQKLYVGYYDYIP